MNFGADITSPPTCRSIQAEVNEQIKLHRGKSNEHIIRKNMN